MTVAFVRELGDHGLRKIRFTRGADARPAVAAITTSQLVPFARMHRWGSRLVPYVEGPKRGLKRGRTLPLSCINAIEVQVNLDGRIHPKPAPYRGA